MTIKTFSQYHDIDLGQFVTNIFRQFDEKSKLNEYALAQEI